MSTLPNRIEVIDGASVEIAWEDGAETTLSASELRAACMCAVCREPAGEAATKAVLEGPVPVVIAEASLVGGYAIQFVFGPDGHGTGIYPFVALRRLGDAAADTPDTVG